MFIDLRPLKKYRDFRFLFAAQLISFLGSMITYVAIPVQIYQLTNSNLMVGLLGTVQLIPVLVFGLIGGSVADTMNRRKLLLISEAIMSLGCLALMINASLEKPSVVLIFAVAAFMQAVNGFHRPAMEAMTQKMIEVEDLPGVAALNSLRSSVGAIIGPAFGGVLIAALGAQAAYLVDFATFAVALFLLSMMRQMPSPEAAQSAGLTSIKEGLSFAMKKPELIGTYVVDIVAMTFAFTTALYPAMGAMWGGTKATGALYSSMSIGALIITAFSGWTSKVKRHGAAVVWAAGLWGVAMIGVGFSPNIYWGVVLLALAGAADSVSGIFRGVIWNETIPNDMRGRMAGIEMISYMVGPLLGNARAGWVASITSTTTSVISGGVCCVIGVVACGILLPRFWRYKSLTAQ